jgi:S-formylglutathione hydrolase
MDDYVIEELPRVVDTLFTVDNSRKSIFGHSMGGHGALSLYLRNPGMFKSVSAFDPVCNPTMSSYG